MESVIGSTICVQLGLLCHDVEKTAKAYSEFFGLEYTTGQSSPQEIGHAMYEGQPTQARCKQAFFNLGNIQLELIEPDEHPSVWRHDLDTKGEGLHHIAFYVKDTDGQLRKLDAMGMKTRQTGGWPGGRYAYVDAQDSLKILLETLENLNEA